MLYEKSESSRSNRSGQREIGKQKPATEQPECSSTQVSVQRTDANLGHQHQALCGLYNYSIKSMPRRDVAVPARALLESGIFYWPRLKIRNLKFARKNTQQVFGAAFNTPIKGELQEMVRAQIDLEIIVTALHQAEILGSYLIAFHKQGKAIQRSLFSYRTGDVKTFYEKIGKRQLMYIAKLFSHPALHQVQPPRVRTRLVTSYRKARRDLDMIGKYYLTHLDLYNSYKHGMRVVCLVTDNEDSGKTYGIIGHLVPHQSFYPAKVVLARVDYKKAEEVSEKATRLMTIAKDVFLKRHLKKELSMDVSLY
jgi:hypothetical protein